MINKSDISDALDFLDEDMIRHTELLRKKHARDKRGIGKRRERLRFGTAAAACVLLLGVLIALMVIALNRGGITGLKEQGEDMTVQQNKESGSEDMSALHAEENSAEDSEEEAAEDFVAIETILAQLEQEEGTFTENSTLEMILSAVDLGEYVGLYEVISQSHSEGNVLSESVGGRVTESEEAVESTASEMEKSASLSESGESNPAGSASLSENDGTETADGYYRVKGHEDLQYLIYKETHAVYAGEGTYAYTEDGEVIEADHYFLLKFVCFDSEEYAYSDVLRLVYQIDSAQDIQQILIKPSKADNTDTGKALQEEIGETTVTDAADIETFYEILSSLTCYGSDRWDLIDLGNWEIAADSAVNDDSQTWSRVLVERYLTFTTDYGNEIDGLKYTAYSDMFYEFNGIAYSALTEEQAESICEILGIDAD
ncbi:MAG: hypothetical protein LUI10_05530 [Lachnospiraceae bacterium]|nr:hypothetical protein [Lachnospiraceae bacterium]